jgi:hypothetical protein
VIRGPRARELEADAGFFLTPSERGDRRLKVTRGIATHEE